MAVGIELINPARLETPVSLADLRKEWPAFQPPQSYRYLDENQIQFITSQIEDAQFAA